jgi:hypothetical protein
VLELTRYSGRDCRRVPGLRIFVSSIAILIMFAMAPFSCTAAGECGELETESHKNIALVRADEPTAHLVETRDGALVTEAPFNGFSKLESAIGI